MALRHVPGLVAVAAVVAFVVLGHPCAFAFDDAGRNIDAASAATLRAIGALGVMDSLAPAAAATLLASVLAAAAIGCALLAGSGEVPEGCGSPVRVPGAVLLAHGVAMIAGGGALFYGLAGTVAAALLFRPGGAAGPGLRSGRAVLLPVPGAVLFLAAGGADGLLQQALGVRPLPEAWFVIASASGAGWMRLEVLGPLVAIAAAAFGIERNGGAGFLPTAAAWALLLGPSNPCRALALAWALRCQARAGFPPAARAAFVVAAVAGTAALVHL